MRAATGTLIALAGSLLACNALVGVTDVEDVGTLAGAAGAASGAAGSAAGTAGAAGKGTAGTSAGASGKGTSGAGTAGTAGSAGTSGTSGSSGTSGTGAAGSGGGTSGTSGSSGTGGSAGSAGSSGSGTSGSSGTGGSGGSAGAGTSGTAGTGTAGTAGVAGMGMAGSGGDAGTGGTGGGTISVGGTLANVWGTVVLKNAATGETISLSADGPFTFPTPSPGAYDVVVETHPAGRWCYVQRGDGASATDVTDVYVGCSTGAALHGVYPMNGTTMDVSGLGNHFNGSNPKFATDRFGRPARAFDGTGGAAEHFSPTPLAYTVTAWVYVPSAEHLDLLGRVGNNGNASNILLVEAGGFPRHYIYWDGGGLEMTASKPVTPGQWVHLAMNGASGGVRQGLFVDGVRAHGYFSSCCNYQTDEDRWILIAGPGAARRLDDVRIYDRMLSEKEIREVFAAESPTPPVDACAGQARGIHDTFSQSLDTTAFRIEQAGLSTATFVPHDEEGSLELANRGLLRTRDELAPSAAMPVHVVASFVATAPGTRDFPGVMTRAKKATSPAVNDAPDSFVWCTAEVRPGMPMSLQVVERVDGTVAGSTSVPFAVNQGDRFVLDVHDDGSSFRCAARNLQTGEQKSLVYAPTGTHPESYVWLVNREWSQSEGDHKVLVDDVSIEHGLPAPTWHWTFDEQTTAAAYPNAGVPGQGTLGTMKRQNGRLGRCAVLDAAGGTSAGMGPSQLGAKDFTIAFWLAQGDPPSALHSIVGTRTPGAFSWWSIRSTSSNELSLEVYQAPGQNGALYVPASYDRSLHHWAFRRAGPNVTAFRDGVVVGSTTWGGTFDANAGATGPTTFGADAFLPGGTECMDDFRIYDTALTDCQVAALATAF